MDDLKNQYTEFLENMTKDVLSIKKLMQMIKLYAQLRQGTLYYYPLFNCFFYAYAGHYLLMGGKGELFNQELYRKIEKNAISLPLVSKTLGNEDLYIVARDFCRDYMISYIDDTKSLKYKNHKKHFYHNVEDDPNLLRSYQDGRQDGGEAGYMLAIKDIYEFLDNHGVLDSFTLNRLHEEFVSQIKTIDFNADMEMLFFDSESDLSIMYNYFEPYLEKDDFGNEKLRDDAPDIVKKTKKIYDQLLDLKARKRAN